MKCWLTSKIRLPSSQVFQFYESLLFNMNRQSYSFICYLLFSSFLDTSQYFRVIRFLDPDYFYLATRPISFVYDLVPANFTALFPFLKRVHPGLHFSVHLEIEAFSIFSFPALMRFPRLMAAIFLFLGRCRESYDSREAPPGNAYFLRFLFCDIYDGH